MSSPKFRKLGAKATFIAADLEEPEAPARIISAAIEQFGKLDGLVNAAGLSDRGSIADADPALFDHLFAVNTRAPMFLMQGLIRHLKERKAQGSIVNILSLHAHGASTNLAIYGATKAALSLLTKNAAFAHRRGSDSHQRHQPWMGGHPGGTGDASDQTGKRRVVAGRGGGAHAMGPPD